MSGTQLPESTVSIQSHSNVPGLTGIAVGTAMLWIPYVRYLGYIICFAGLAWIAYDPTPRQIQDRNFSVHSAQIGGISVLVLFLLVPVFWLLANYEVSPAPEIVNSASREEVYTITFLSYFMLAKFAYLFLVFSLVLCVWNLARVREQRLMASGLVITIALVLTDIVLLNPALNSPYNALSGTVVFNSYILNQLNLPNRFVYFYVIPSSIFFSAFALVRRRLKKSDLTASLP